MTLEPLLMEERSDIALNAYCIVRELSTALGSDHVGVRVQTPEQPAV